MVEGNLQDGIDYNRGWYGAIAGLVMPGKIYLRM